MDEDRRRSSAPPPKKTSIGCIVKPIQLYSIICIIITIILSIIVIVFSWVIIHYNIIILSQIETLLNASSVFGIFSIILSLCLLVFVSLQKLPFGIISLSVCLILFGISTLVMGTVSIYDAAHSPNMTRSKLSLLINSYLNNTNSSNTTVAENILTMVQMRYNCCDTMESEYSLIHGYSNSSVLCCKRLQRKYSKKKSLSKQYTCSSGCLDVLTHRYYSIFMELGIIDVCLAVALFSNGIAGCIMKRHFWGMSSYVSLT